MLTVCAFPHTRNKGLPYCTPTWEVRWDRVEVGVHCLTVVAFHCVTYDYAAERPPQTGYVMLIIGTGGSFYCCWVQSKLWGSQVKIFFIKNITQDAYSPIDRSNSFLCPLRCFIYLPKTLCLKKRLKLRRRKRTFLNHKSSKCELKCTYICIFIYIWRECIHRSGVSKQTVPACFLAPSTGKVKSQFLKSQIPTAEVLSKWQSLSNSLSPPATFPNLPTSSSHFLPTFFSTLFGLPVWFALADW